MQYTSESIEKVVEHFSSLPTIGRKTAQRLTYYLLRQPKDFIESFASSMIELKNNVRFCSTCFNYTETDPCPICSSEKRDKSIVCVVEEPNDVLAIEKTNEFKGYYHVLHGVLNPLEGVSQEDLKIKELIERMDGINEVVLEAVGVTGIVWIVRKLTRFRIETKKPIACTNPEGSSPILENSLNAVPPGTTMRIMDKLSRSPVVLVQSPARTNPESPTTILI